MIERELSTVKPEEIKKLNIKKPYSLYGPQPSPECPKGTRGRVAVFEMLEMTPQLEQIILKEPSESKIKEEAKRQGMTNMLQDGIIKALRGLVSLEDVKREVEE